MHIHFKKLVWLRLGRKSQCKAKLKISFGGHGTKSNLIFISGYLCWRLCCWWTCYKQIKRCCSHIQGYKWRFNSNNQDSSRLQIGRYDSTLTYIWRQVMGSGQKSLSRIGSKSTQVKDRSASHLLRVKSMLRSGWVRAHLYWRPKRAG